MNTAIEADLTATNSTHVVSHDDERDRPGDFTRNAYLSIFSRRHAEGRPDLDIVRS
jgi:acyl-CoA hydrolase